MAGRRMLHGNICESRKLSAVSLGAEALYYRLLTQTDDGGNFFFDGHIIWGRCFPLRKDVDSTMVEGWRDELVSIGLLSDYTYRDEKYLHFNRFSDFQYLRSDRNPDIRYPAPNGKPPVNPAEPEEQEPQVHIVTPESKLKEENRKESKYVRSTGHCDSQKDDPTSVFVELRRKFRRKVAAKSIGSLGRREYEWNGAVARHGAETIFAAAERWMEENKTFLKGKCTLPIWNFMDRLAEYVEAVSIDSEPQPHITDADDDREDPDDFLRECGVSEERIVAQNKRAAVR